MTEELKDWKKELQELSDVNSCIKESEVLYRMPIEEHSNWENFMRGKTCPILDNGDHGVYSWDLAQFLKRKSH